MSGVSQTASPVEERGPPPGQAPVLSSHGSIGSITSAVSTGSASSTSAHAPILSSDINGSDIHQLQRRDSQGKNKAKCN